MVESLYDIEVETLGGERKSLRQYRGKVMLVVNTASECGFTPQYAGLEKLHEKLAGRGLVVLGFPCNQFGHAGARDAATRSRRSAARTTACRSPSMRRSTSTGPRRIPSFGY